MDFKVDAKDIEKAVVQAVVDSSIGDEIRKAVEDQIKGLTGYDGAVKKIVASEFAKLLQSLIREDYREQIETIMREKLTDEMMSTIFQAAWDAMMDKMGRGW